MWSWTNRLQSSEEHRDHHWRRRNVERSFGRRGTRSYVYRPSLKRHFPLESVRILSVRKRYRRNTKRQILIRPFLRLTFSYHSSCKSSRVDIRALHPQLLSRDGLRRTWPAFLEANQAPSMVMARYRSRAISCLSRFAGDTRTRLSFRMEAGLYTIDILARQYYSWTISGRWVGEAGWKGDDLRGIWNNYFCSGRCAVSRRSQYHMVHKSLPGLLSTT